MEEVWGIFTMLLSSSWPLTMHYRCRSQRMLYENLWSRGLCFGLCSRKRCRNCFSAYTVYLVRNSIYSLSNRQVRWWLNNKFTSEGNNWSSKLTIVAIEKAAPVWRWRSKKSLYCSFPKLLGNSIQTGRFSRNWRYAICSRETRRGFSCPSAQISRTSGREKPEEQK